jgi:hypothetical protein
VPFTSIYLKFNFAAFQRQRTAIAERLLSPEFEMTSQSNGCGHIVNLSGSNWWLSEEGEVMVCASNAKEMVFFFTFRGILGHFSGFIYSADDAAPQEGDFGGRWIEIEHLRKRWYWASSM